AARDRPRVPLPRPAIDALAQRPARDRSRTRDPRSAVPGATDVTHAARPTRCPGGVLVRDRLGAPPLLRGPRALPAADWRRFRERPLPGVRLRAADPALPSAFRARPQHLL